MAPLGRSPSAGPEPSDSIDVSTSPSPGKLSPEELLATDFPTAARAVVAFLRDRLGFDLWMVTRTDHDDWVVLTAEDHGYGVSDGSLFRWSDSFCSRMVEGLGPRIAPDSSLVSAYASAPIGQQVQIRAYVGVPIQCGGELFGTLCAINPEPVSEALASELPLIELLAGLLGNILVRERAADDERRRAERAELASMTDSLTGLMNRRGWDSVLQREESRSRRYGDSAAVVIVDLDGLKQVNDTRGHPAGDMLIRRAAVALTSTSRESDVVARLGGDEFGLLILGAGQDEVEAVVGRVRNALRADKIEASVGACARHPSGGLEAAFAEADRRLMADKQARRKTAAP